MPRLPLEAITCFTAGADGARFHVDALLRSAVERQFEILGFRNVLAHGYDVIDDGITWDIVINKLPRLHAEIRAMLA
jgi:uncharacterized protein with HEPN domain